MLSWNEIRSRSVAFAKEWQDEKREAAEYQSFWDEFFNIYGVRRRSVARYQEKVKLAIPERQRGFIDLFLPGTLIAEHKSAGENLDSAYAQAGSYFDALSEEDKPRYIVVTDYARMCFYDLESKNGIEKHEFALAELPKYINLFGFIAGRPAQVYHEEDPVNRKAVRLVVGLYRALYSGHYPPEHLSQLMVRLVFCFFADDTGIFEKDSFSWHLKAFTRQDGSDFGSRLAEIFQVLNTPESERQSNINADLQALPYVNGGLFANWISLPLGFTAEMREAVIKAAEFDWTAVSPAIFGSMFQFVMDEGSSTQRHDFGAHYTSERNILKVINGLFLDELYAELKAAGQNAGKLNALWKKIAQISLLDPACGCGNFLVVAYRELRKLETEILSRLHHKEIEAGQSALPFDITNISKLSVERMYGIELLSFPAEIARLSLWLTDHLANIELGDTFGKPLVKLPLKDQPHIVLGNALTTDWESVVPKNKLTYILGNPPFIGSRVMDKEQKEEVKDVFGNIREVGFLDYVTGWYIKAARMMHGTDIACAFVSTNSIVQGEQVGILWDELRKLNIHITFAHQTFKWSNEAPGKAAVYCVIIGFATHPQKEVRLFEYEDIKGEPKETRVEEINPYLIAASADVIIRNRQKPLCDVPEMSFGNMPRDGGALILSEEEKQKLLQNESGAEKFVRPYVGAQEFLHNEKRYCLWLVDVKPDELRALPEVMRRVEAVKMFRLASVAASTRKMAETPYLFAQRTQPKTDYILIPSVSSERRRYVPMGFFSPYVVLSNLCLAVPNATLYHFGVLESEMHMTWMRAVAGRLKSDYRYSKDIVYNNFPWPDANEVQKKAIEDAAQTVLDVRTQFPDATLADLYDPNTMPKVLLDAHHALDHAVDAAYDKKSFKSEPERLEFLFDLYKNLNLRQSNSSKDSVLIEKRKFSNAK